MAAVGSVQHSRLEQVAPKTISPSRMTELFQKVDWVLVFSVTVVTGYLLYNLYKVFQFSSHSTSGLSEQFRLVKCRALLEGAREKYPSDAHPLLQECEALMATITDRLTSPNKQRLVLDLALYYVKTNPDQAYQIAGQLSSSHRLIEVAEEIQKQHPGFDQVKLDSIWKAAFLKEVARDQSAFLKEVVRGQRPSKHKTTTPLSDWLKFAEGFHALGNARLKNKAFEQALARANDNKDPLERMTAWRQIAEVCQKTKDTARISVCIKETQRFMTDDTKLEDSIHAHLELAYMYFYAQRYPKMQQELGRIEALFNEKKAPVQAEHISALVWFIQTIKKTDGVPPEFKNFQVEHLIEKAYDGLIKFKEEMKPGERVGLFLRIFHACRQMENQFMAMRVLGEIEKLIFSISDDFERAQFLLTQAYHYKSYKEDDSAKRMAKMALAVIRDLPESKDEEKHAKWNLLIELLRMGAPDEEVEALQALENLYGKIPNDKFFDKKIDKGMTILWAYNQRNKTGESEAFFTKFLADFEKSNDAPLSKISRLSFKFHYMDKPEQVFKNATNLKQARALLETAEKQIPQLSSDQRDEATALIAQAYLRIDTQKALEILKSTQNSYAARHLTVAAVAALALGTMYYSDFYAPIVVSAFLEVKQLI